MDLIRGMWAARGVFSGAELRPGQLTEAISRYQEQVQRDIPEDRLLVWNVQEGWEPMARGNGGPPAAWWTPRRSSPPDLGLGVPLLAGWAWSLSRRACG
jgi:Sulfotransferase domain